MLIFQIDTLRINVCVTVFAEVDFHASGVEAEVFE